MLQRRCIRVNKDVSSNQVITNEDIEFQRPAPPGSLSPNLVDRVLGKTLSKSATAGEHLTLDHVPREK